MKIFSDVSSCQKQISARSSNSNNILIHLEQSHRCSLLRFSTTYRHKQILPGLIPPDLCCANLKKQPSPLEEIHVRLPFVRYCSIKVTDAARLTRSDSRAGSEETEPPSQIDVCYVKQMQKHTNTHTHVSTHHNKSTHRLWTTLWLRSVSYTQHTAGLITTAFMTPIIRT